MISKKLIAMSMGMALSFASAGIVQAEESENDHDRTMCEQEAEQAGMVSPSDIRAYVEQCLEEIRIQNEEFDQGHGSDREDDGKWN